MHFTDYLMTPGEHSLTLQGVVGPLEAVLSVPETITTPYVALLGHPHSLQGGTMTNKVVTTLGRVFKELNIPSLRFNFRGVGQSSGVYDHGVGESEDMLLLAQEWQNHQEARFIFAGFSFGSYVVYRTASHFPKSILISIAPPVHHYNYNEFQLDLASWLIVQGDNDEVVPYQLVEEFAKKHVPELPLLTFPETGHFFHGKLIELKSQLLAYLKPQVNLA
ncbi:alpha/beta hydrolase [Legionella sp. km772]|uniref:alpha/beta hydrolase n=1 Tax=Legionella sp. km772 TaxID=2498111 RepID=UPI000F8F03CA|nr:hypothetical protein [Legionella sp. km772]RUR12992.1 hypothetical protein ELY15_03460 [Legionella sp. km772]